ncbi:MAG: hypothetical protein KA715_04985 [Xanthomonadaceae bacterium]|nr:hypothetical protein [Xanthomonadaceae bacterium]
MAKNNWLLISMVLVMSGCGGGSMRAVDQNLQGKSESQAKGKCSTNAMGFLELAYRNSRTGSIGYPETQPTIVSQGENRLKIVEPVSLKQIQLLDAQYEPVLIFPSRCFTSELVSVTYKHSENRPDQKQIVIQTTTFEADRKGEMQFSLLEAGLSGKDNIFPGSIQVYDLDFFFSDGSVFKLTAEVQIEPLLPLLQVESLGGSGFSNDMALWGNKSKNWFAPIVYEAQRVTNHTDRPVRMWLTSHSSFKLRLNCLNSDFNAIFSGNAKFSHQGRLSIHTASIYGSDGVTCLNCGLQLGFATPQNAIDIPAHDSVVVKWEVQPSPDNWPWVETPNAYWDSKGYHSTSTLIQVGGSLRGTDSRGILASEVSENTYSQQTSRVAFTKCIGSCFGRLDRDELFYSGGDSALEGYKLRDGVIFTGI